MTPDPSTIAFRFGYGLPLPAGTATTPKGMLDALTAPDIMAITYPGPSMDAMRPIMQASDDALKTSRRSQDEGEAQAARTTYRAHLATLQDMALTGATATIARALHAPDGFRERLAWFWADHFTTVATGRRDLGLPSAMLDEAIRPNLTGPFANLLRAAITHPAMLTYLDQTRSFGPNSRTGLKRKKGLNENLARELLELHTLGAGAAYTQDDVRQMAELLTGLIVGKDGFRFDKRRAEPGAESILGVDYAGDTLTPVFQALDDLARRPDTATHIARKLAVHFVSGSPDPTLVTAVAQAFSNSGGDLMATYAALLNHPATWSNTAAKARQPIDFMISSLRALGMTGARIIAMDATTFRRLILTPMADMGQKWQSAPGPDGWAEAPTAWITPQGMAARITWAMDAPERLVQPTPDPGTLMQTALGARATAAIAWAIPRSESLREGIGLVFSSPEFNRR